MERVVRELPTEVRNILRSGVVITNTSQCIVELILNALDSGASSIAIRIHLGHHRIQVVDNGCGMDSNTLNLVGLRYMTSKCHSLDDLKKHLEFYGFRGEALASLRNVSKSLTIESRTADSTQTHSKVFNFGEAENVVLTSTNRPSPGTTVTINDFLYNMPVRQQRINETLDLEEMRMFVEALALIHPEVAFNLRNDINGTIILQTPRTFKVEKTFSFLFGATITQSLVRVKHKSDKFKVIGFISREAHAPKHLQFVYVNKRIVHKTAIHKLVNAMLAKSSILQSEQCRNVAVSKKKTYGNWLAYSPPPKRDNSAVFLLNIKCAYIEYDVSLDPKKTLIEFLDWSSVLKCVENTVRIFLEAEGLVSKPPADEPLLPINNETETLRMYTELLGQAGFSHDLVRGVRGRAAVRPRTSVESETSEISDKSLSDNNVRLPNPYKSIFPSVINSTSKTNKEASPDKTGCRSTSRPVPEVDLCESMNTPSNPLSLILEVTEELSPIVCASSLGDLTPNFSTPDMGRKLKKKASPNKIHSNISEILEVSNIEAVPANNIPKFVPFKDNRDTNKVTVTGFPIFKTPYLPKRISRTKGRPINYATARLQAHLENSELSEDPIGGTETENTPAKSPTRKNKKKYETRGVPARKNLYISKHSRAIQDRAIKTKTAIIKQHSQSSELSEDPFGGTDTDTTSIKHLFANIRNKKSTTKCVSKLRRSHLVRRNATTRQLIDRSKVSPKKKRSENSELSEDPLGETDTDTAPPATHLKDKDRSKKRGAKSGAVFKQTLHTKPTTVNAVSKITTKPPLLKPYLQIRHLSETPIGDTDTENEITRSITLAQNKERRAKYLSNKSRLAHVDRLTRDKVGNGNNSLFAHPILRHVDKNMAYFRLQDAGLGRLARILEKFAPRYSNMSSIQIQKRTLTVTRQVTTVRSTLTSIADESLNVSENMTDDARNQGSNILSPYFAIPNARPDNPTGPQVATNVPRLLKAVEHPTTIQEKLPIIVQSPYFVFSPKVAVNNVIHLHPEKQNVTRFHPEKQNVMHFHPEKHLPRLPNPQPPLQVAGHEHRNLSQIRASQFLECQQNLLPRQTFTATKPLAAEVELRNNHGRFQHCKTSRNQPHETTNYYSSEDSFVEPNYRNLSRFANAVDPLVTSTSRLNTLSKRYLANSNCIRQRRCDYNYKNNLTQEATQYCHNDGLMESINNISRKFCINSPATRINCSSATKKNFLSSTDFICTLNKFKQMPRNNNQMHFDNFKFGPLAFNETCRLGVHETGGPSLEEEMEPWRDLSTRPLVPRVDILVPNYSVRATPPMSFTSCGTVAPALPPVDNEHNSTTYFRRMLSIQRKYHSHSCESSQNQSYVESEPESIFTEVPTSSSLNTWNSHAFFDRTKIPRSSNAQFQDSVRFNTKVAMPEDFAKRWAPVNRDSVLCGPEEFELENNSSSEDLEWPQWLSPVSTDLSCYHPPLVMEFQLPRPGGPSEHPLKRRAEENVGPNRAKKPHGGQNGTDAELDERSSCVSPHRVANEIVSVADPEFSPITVTNITSSEDCISNTTDENMPSMRQRSENQVPVEKGTADSEILRKSLESQSDVDIIPDTPQQVISRTIPTSIISCEKSRQEVVAKENLSVVSQEKNHESVQVLSETAKDVSQIHKEWVQRFDGEGTAFFVHIRSGMTSFDPPGERDPFSMTKRYGFLPKGMSPILQDPVGDGERTKDLSPGSRQDVHRAVEDASAGMAELSTIKWREDLPGCAELIRKMVEDSERKMQFCEVAVRDACIQERNAVKVNNLITSYTFTKEIFSNIRVLGQLDNKFIVTMASVEADRKTPHLMVFFDQHAVHERIRLERLMKEYLEEGSDSTFKSSPLDAPLIIPVTPEESRIISGFASHFSRLGLEMTATLPSVLVTRVPTCLERRRDGRHVATLEACVQSLLREQVRALVEGRGVGVRVPVAMQDAVNSEACRGAIKFGDSLSSQTCAMLLEDLSQCDLPFQCAHGRPCLVPIVDLQSLGGQPGAQTAPKPSYWKLK